MLKEFGLKTNFKKIQVIFNSLADHVENILLERTPLEKVDSFTFLSYLTTMNSNKEAEIKKKGNITWMASF